jgi:hypothetical protein
MAKRIEFSGFGSEPEPKPAEDAGRLDGASRGRLIAIIAALVLFSEVAPFQAGMISIIVPKIAQSFPQAGANVTWSYVLLGVIPAAVTFIIVYLLRTGRTPALGGAPAPVQEEAARV